MSNILHRSATFLFLVFLLPLNSFSLISSLPPLVAQGSFLFPALPAELAAPPAAFTPVPVFTKGDFSRIPDYSFTYLNDLNTHLIDASLRSVDISIFSINLKDNPEALVRAKNRGVRVRMIIDEGHVSPRPDPLIRSLISEGGIEIRTLRGTRAYGVNHNKIGIFDGSAAATGSYNWTFGATFSNLENTLVARHPEYIDGYSRYFEWMWSKARTLEQGPSAELPEGYYGTPPQDPAPAQSLNGTPVPAFLFSPGSRSEERLAGILDSARSSIDIVTFTFSSKVLADAIVRARGRGVKVRFLMDMNMAKVSAMAKYIFDSGVEFRWRLGRTEKGALHDKFAILDGQILETGSFNWTANASLNSFENIIFVSDTGAVKAYEAVYEELYRGGAAPASGDFQPEPVGAAD